MFSLNGRLSGNQPPIKAVRNEGKMIILTIQRGVPTERKIEIERGKREEHSLIHYDG